MGCFTGLYPTGGNEALNLMLRQIPHSRDAPLFKGPSQGFFLPLMDLQARKHLKSVCQYLQFTRYITLHDFRH